MLLLPDRDEHLESFDRVAGGVKCFGAMGGRDRYDDAGIAGLEQSGAMDDCDAIDTKLLLDLIGNDAHLMLGGGGIGLVIKRCDRFATGKIAHFANERENGAAAGVADECLRCARIDLVGRNHKLADARPAGNWEE